MSKLSLFPLISRRALLALLALLGMSPNTHGAVSQTPLLIGGDIPGSLALVPSVEWPTVLSVANINNYVSATRYTGYFDSEKCYLYQYGTQELDRYFYPVRKTENFRCTGEKEWSGNFLNWAATPTIDPFRSALTGGNRVVDTTTSTILQKARHSGQSDAGNRINTGQDMTQLEGALPLDNWNSLNIRLEGLGFDMLISNWTDKIGGTGYSEGDYEWTDYDPNNSAQWEDGKLKTAYYPPEQGVKSVYRLRIQVKVCVSESLKEANCKRYPNGQYKPEGLLQQYANNLRYSAFSYLNVYEDRLRDGGVLRANQAYIGPNPPDQTTNRAEWSSETGILVSNPSTSEAQATNDAIDNTGRIVNSGVINYINKFGSMPYRGNLYRKLKDFDPVSELYYTALRYFKNQGNVNTYSELTGDSDDRYAQADGFPVVTNWIDPITYSCQKNVILGIGDVNTWSDKNLPGNLKHDQEPALPPEVAADTTVNVVTATSRVAALEGISIPTPFDNEGRQSSAYIAGLAFDAHVKDQRNLIPGKQTISTYWVDVREGQLLKPKTANQYWLATKYGGFTVPQGFDPETAAASSITDAMWTTNGQTLSSGDKRPDNFFVGGDAAGMVAGLKNAFARIAQETATTNTSLGTSSSELNTGSVLFKASYEPKFWSGDLQALSVDSSGQVSNGATWSAATILNTTEPSARKILTSNIATTSERDLDANAQFSRGSVNFLWSELDDDAKTALRRTNDESTHVNESEGQARVDYLRGNRSYETRASNPMRERRSRLGDIVNSDPLYIDTADYGYNLLTGSAWGTAGSTYINFRQSIKDRKPMVVVGANDGMLHTFDASSNNGGNELFAFIPRTLLGELYRLTQPDYSHRYYVDGSAKAGDAWINNSWKTLVVGSTGAGGKAVFALDVTNPESPAVLWEFTSTEINYPIQRPSLVALANGKFGVIVSSGFSDGSVTSGKLWILDAADGSVISKFNITTEGSLSEPTAIDLDNDRVADRIYVGDTIGNVWRFDIVSSDPANWSAPTSLGSAPLFTAKTGNTSDAVAQPITSAISVALNKDGNPILLFGTGSYYKTGDNEVPDSPRLESYYGIIDHGQNISRSALVEQTIIAQETINGKIARVMSNNSIPTNKSGWYLNLAVNSVNKGERVISRASVANGVLSFASLIPSADPCQGGGVSPVTKIDVLSGGRLSYAVFDINGDGVINDQDYYVATDGTKTPYSSVIDPEQGAIKTPTQINRGEDADTDLICYSGSANSAPKCEPISKGARVSERASWQEIR
ncbi:PilC/PilY family type IV pilus protein [Pseudomonas sp. MS15a(2019)]|nr:PilC/PilY family type IV pilus protein [Pseudomonas sp. MS15a(2019)]NRH42957.1 pilus assembly protein PilC [Pseudomonas sp. MS15a(2019)]